LHITRNFSKVLQLSPIIILFRFLASTVMHLRIVLYTYWTPLPTNALKQRLSKVTHLLF